MTETIITTAMDSTLTFLSTSKLHMSQDEKAEIEKEILGYLANNGSIQSSYEFANEFKRPHVAVVGVAMSLSASNMIVMTAGPELQLPKPTEDGHLVLAQGSPEFRLYNAISPDGTTTRDSLTSQFSKEFMTIALGPCMKNKWISMTKDGVVSRLAASVVDACQNDLVRILTAASEGKLDSTAEAATIKTLVTRKMLETQKIKVFQLSKGPEFSLERKVLLDDLTVDSLRSGQWKELEFKSFNVLAEGKPASSGTLHPLLKVRAEFRSFLVQMGFQEMPTNNFVESSFWNFDTLFQPQQHPARDAHDTFFLSEPATADLSRSCSAEYVKAVKDVHERGGYDSIGYRYDWKEEEAAKNILRTHTTAVSSRMLARLAQEYNASKDKSQEFKPAKFFSIDRVFRNETLDATHLAEFHQVEGLVADRGLTLGDLIGTIQTFFHKIGVTDIKFKPAYNPYTEPSMEIFGFSKELKKWVEIGNSGIFRPEMLGPMGLPKDVRVIAWGLSLERPTMIKYGLENIRDLVGPKMKLDIIRANPVPRYP